MRTTTRGLCAVVLIMGVATTMVGCRTPGRPTPTTTTTTTKPGGWPAPTLVPVKYGAQGGGPFKIGAAPQGGMEMIHNRIIPNVAKPCSNCYVTSMQADLVDAAGESVNVDDGLWLHHMVMFEGGKEDVTCPGRGVGLLGQRFFSSGNERTPTSFGPTHGYAVGNGGWTLIGDLMSMAPTAQDVWIQVTFGVVPLDTPGMRPMTPVWLDINQCGTSERPAQTGRYNYTYDYTVERTGRLLGTAGHLHDGGTNLTIEKNGQLVCNSEARYGSKPEYIEGPTSTHMPGMAHVSEMTMCQGTYEQPVTSVQPGDVLKLTANYDADTHMQMGDEPVMGIAVSYFDFN